MMETAVGSDNDRRVLLAIALIMVVYYVWVAFISPPPPPVADEALAAATTQAVPVEATAPIEPLAEPEPSVQVPDRSQPMSTETWRGALTSASGALTDLTLRDYTTSPETHALYSWIFAKVQGKADGPWQAYSGGDQALRLLTDRGAVGLAGTGALGSDSGYLIEGSGDNWVARRSLASGLTIKKRYWPGEDPHTIMVEIEFDNTSGQAVDRLWVGVVDEMAGDAGRFANAPRPQAVVDGDIEHLMDLDDVEGIEVDRHDGPVSWFGVGDRYFMTALALEEAVDGAVVFDTLPDGRTGAFMVDATTLDAGARRTYTFTAFMGQKDLDLLQRLGHDLEEAVEFGIFGFFSKMLLFLLKVAQKGVTNWGVAIIILTLLVKAVFYPLTQKAFVSSKKMQALQPLMKQVQEKYKDNKELSSTETMKLFKEHGVNPMGGCLPTFIQLPVWFALYGVMLNSVELYDTSFLYLKDLTAADPYGVLPVLYAVLIVGQQQLMPMGSMDPAQQRMMKMLPLVFAFMMFTFPSGLVLYFCVNILLTVVQQWLINRSFDDGQPPLQTAAT